MSARKAMSAEVKIADDFTNDEIRTHSERSLAVIGTLHNEWPGLVKLPSSDKSGNLGTVPRLAVTLSWSREFTERAEANAILRVLSWITRRSETS